MVVHHQKEPTEVGDPFCPGISRSKCVKTVNSKFFENKREGRSKVEDFFLGLNGTSPVYRWRPGQ